MKLYHPSNKKFNIVEVKHFGENPYTLRDLRASKIKRSFWYFTSEIPEQRFRYMPYIYVIKVRKSDLYDLRNKKYISKKYSNINILLKNLKKQDKGIIYNVGRYNIVAIFEDMKIIKIIERIK